MAGRRPFFRGLHVIEDKFIDFVVEVIVFCITCVFASFLLLATHGPFFGFDHVPGLTWVLVCVAGVVTLTLFCPLRNLGRKLTETVGIMLIAFLLSLLVRFNTTAFLATSEYNHYYLMFLEVFVLLLSSYIFLLQFLFFSNKACARLFRPIR